MTSVVENKIDINDIKKSISDNEKQIVVISNELGHFNDYVKRLDRKIGNLQLIINNQSKRLESIYEQNERYKNRWQTIKAQWWKVAAFCFTAGALIEKTFDIVWQIK